MYEFDEKFLEEVGLAGMPEEQRKTFLDYAQDQLEVRVGEKMSEGLTDAQIDEFEKIIDGDAASVNAVLAKSGDYRNDELFQRIAQNSEGEQETINSYVTAKWLNENCPNYKNIIEEVVNGLRDEIRNNKDAILAA